MREESGALPLAIDSPAFSIRTTDWGDMAAIVIETKEKVDMGPALKGLPGDMCQVAHWGYMIKGSAHLKYSDGREEETREGDLYYWPAPHTGWFEANTTFAEFSPRDQYSDLMKHLKGGG